MRVFVQLPLCLTLPLPVRAFEAADVPGDGALPVPTVQLHRVAPNEIQVVQVIILQQVKTNVATHFVFGLISVCVC